MSEKPASKRSDDPKIVMVALKDLIPYARNARTHSEAQVAQIAASIREFGWTNPVLVDGERGIIAGHGRVLAARKLGIAEVPTIELAHLTDAQKRAYILADNRLAESAGWDNALLSIELGELKDLEFDLKLTGFDEDELSRLLGPKPGATDENEVPDAPEKPVSRLGDLWILGNHRILCGDSTKAEDVSKVLGKVKPHLMVTDPPYGVEYDPARRIGAAATGKVLNDDRFDWREAWALFPGEVAYVWHASIYSPQVAESLKACSFEMRALIVWGKQRFTLGRGHYQHGHEPCWYAVKKGATGHWHGDRKQSTLWTISNTRANEDADTEHGTQKPAECMRRPIENNSSPGQAVYEPFSGSGTTIIAAEQTGRSCHAIELSPRYVDVAVLRWQAFAKAPAVLDGDGRSYEEIAAERVPAEAKAPRLAKADKKRGGA